jgi:23S rRNA pseudoU1915 N3-methylase RlmH
MFTFDLIINPIVLVVAGVIGIIIGYVVAKGMLAKAKSTISRLESDLLACNAETLEAQRAYVELEARLQDQAIPVIPMKISGKEMSSDKFAKEKSAKEKEKATN